MGESDTSVLVAEVHAPGQSDIDNLKRLIKGNLMDIKKVSQLADEMQVKKVRSVMAALRLMRLKNSWARLTGVGPCQNPHKTLEIRDISV